MTLRSHCRETTARQTPCKHTENCTSPHMLERTEAAAAPLVFNQTYCTSTTEQQIASRTVMRFSVLTDSLRWENHFSSHRLPTPSPPLLSSPRGVPSQCFCLSIIFYSAPSEGSFTWNHRIMCHQWSIVMKCNFDFIFLTSHAEMHAARARVYVCVCARSVWYLTEVSGLNVFEEL